MKTSNRTIYSAKNVYAGFLYKGILILFQFIIRAVMIRTIGAVFLGLNSLFTSLLQMLSIAELGFGNAIIYSMYKPFVNNDKKKICALLNQYRKIYYAVGSVILIIGIALMPFLEYFIEGDVPDGINLQILYLIHLANTVLGYFLFAYKTSLFTASQKDYFRFNIRSFVMSVTYLVQIVLLYTTKNYYLYAMTLPISAILINILNEIFSRKYYKEYICQGDLEKKEKRDIIKRSTGLFAFQLGGVVFNNADTVIISSFLGLTILAKYTNYYVVMQGLNAILLTVASGLQPSIGNCIATETIEYNVKRFKLLSKIFTWIDGLFCVCILCLIQPFMSMWMGKEYLLSETNVIWMVVYFYFWNFNFAVSIYKNAAGLWWEDKFRPLIGAVLNLSINIVLVKKIGLNGVLISSIVTALTTGAPWAAFYLFKGYLGYSMKMYLLEQGTLFVVFSSGAFLSSYLCNVFFSQYTITNFIMRIMICIVVPNVLYILAFLIKGEFKEMKDHIFRYIKVIIKK